MQIVDYCSDFRILYNIAYIILPQIMSCARSWDFVRIENSFVSSDLLK
jgi:hypothetical protein